MFFPPNIYDDHPTQLLSAKVFIFEGPPRLHAKNNFESTTPVAEIHHSRQALNYYGSTEPNLKAALARKYSNFALARAKKFV